MGTPRATQDPLLQYLVAPLQYLVALLQCQWPHCNAGGPTAVHLHEQKPPPTGLKGIHGVKKAFLVSYRDALKHLQVWLLQECGLETCQGSVTALCVCLPPWWLH